MIRHLFVTIIVLLSILPTFAAAGDYAVKLQCGKADGRYPV